MAAHDLIEGLYDFRLWSSLAAQDIKNKYRRAFLGPLWITASMGITISFMGPLYSGIFGAVDSGFVPSLGFGLILWAALSVTISESCETFSTCSAVMKNIRTSCSLYIYRVVLRQLITMGHNFILIIPIYIIYPMPNYQSLIFLAPSILIMVVFMLGSGCLIAVICTRYRDLVPLTQSTLQLIFFITPIVWPLRSLPQDRRLLVEYNPIYYIIEMVRRPLVGSVPSLDEYALAAGISLTALVLGALAINHKKDHIVYWV